MVTGELKSKIDSLWEIFWTGGLTKAPEGWAPGHGDPYAGDKPLYSIDAGNLAQHEAELPPGQVQLIKTYPGYRMDVYPTHRSCTFPDQLAQRTREFAGQSRIAADGWQLEQAPGLAIPFPMPQSGVEVMWNYKLRYMGKGRRVQASLLLREKSGTLSEFKQWDYEYYPYNDPAVKSPADAGGYEAKLLYDVLSPSSRAGEMYLVHGYLDKPQDSWVYVPGQRRVRRAPSFARAAAGCAAPPIPAPAPPRPSAAPATTPACSMPLGVARGRRHRA